jgi:hypothetical protein
VVPHEGMRAGQGEIEKEGTHGLIFVAGMATCLPPCQSLYVPQAAR